MTSKPFTTCLWFDNQGEEAAHYPLTLVVSPLDELELQFDYRPDVFGEAAVQALAERMRRVLEQIAADPGVPVSRLDVVGCSPRLRQKESRPPSQSQSP